MIRHDEQSASKVLAMAKLQRHRLMVLRVASKIPLKLKAESK
jgi:hypothetical protein